MYILSEQKCHRVCHVALVEQNVSVWCVCARAGTRVGGAGSIPHLVPSAHFRYFLIESVSAVLEFCYKMMKSSTLTLNVIDVLWLKYGFGKTKIDPLHLK